MNYTLCINTASYHPSIQLFEQSKQQEALFLEHSNKSESLLEEIDSLLSKNSLSIKDVGSLLYVNGPGSFTGLRIGLSIISTIFEYSDVDLIEIDAISWWEAIAEGSSKVIISAGIGTFFVRNTESGISKVPISDLGDGPFLIDIPGHQRDKIMLNTGMSFVEDCNLSYDIDAMLKKAHKVKNVSAEYFSAPHITKPR